MAYQKSTIFHKACLWGSTLSFLMFWLVFLSVDDGTIYFWIAVCAMLVWILSFRSILKNFISQFEINPLFLKLYGKEHQAIRYVLFSEKIDGCLTKFDFDSALNHLMIEIDTSPKPLSLPPSIQLFSALFFAIVGGQAGDWNKEFVALILMAVGLYVMFHFLFNRLTKPRLDHLRELQRFLMWKKSELDRTKKLTPVWRHREKANGTCKKFVQLTLHTPQRFYRFARR